MTRYCSFCGTKIREDGVFCEGCGREIKSEKETKKEIEQKFREELKQEIKEELEKEQRIKEEKLKKVRKKSDRSQPLTWKVTKRDLIYIAIILFALFLFLVIVMPYIIPH